MRLRRRSPSRSRSREWVLSCSQSLSHSPYLRLRLPRSLPPSPSPSLHTPFSPFVRFDQCVHTGVHRIIHCMHSKLLFTWNSSLQQHLEQSIGTITAKKQMQTLCPSTARLHTYLAAGAAAASASFFDDFSSSLPSADVLASLASFFGDLLSASAVGITSDFQRRTKSPAPTVRRE